MNILVIGNGFDLAHGLPTKYDDFMNFLEYVHSEVDNDPKKVELAENICSEIKDMIRDEIEDEDKPKYHKSIYDITCNNTLITHLNQVRKTHRLYHRWVDFEEEIMNVCNKLKSAVDSAPDTDLFNSHEEADIISICNHYPTDAIMLDSNLIADRPLYCKRKWNLVTESFTNEFRKLCLALELYISCYVNKMEISVISGNLSHFDRIISFNYTNTFQRLYESFPEIVYIHGKAAAHDTMESNIILGFQESDLTGSQKEVYNFLEFTKKFQRDVNNTIEKFHKWEIEMRNEDVESTLTFYGHSLGIADADIITTLISNNNVDINVLYRTNDEHKRLRKNLFRCNPNLYDKNKHHIRFSEI